MFGRGPVVVNTRWLHPQAHKVQISVPGRKKEVVKKQAKKSSVVSVPAKNQGNLKKCVFKSSSRAFVYFLLF